MKDDKRRTYQLLAWKRSTRSWICQKHPWFRKIWLVFIYWAFSIRKDLKAVFVDRNDNNMPPKIHNLVRLAELSKIELDEDQKFNLDKITDFNIQTRYPDYKLDFYKRCNVEYTNEYLAKIKEFYAWFSSLLK